MFYLVCSIYSIGIFLIVRYSQNGHSLNITLEGKKLLLFLPFIYWILLIGSQYYVGTDYLSYYTYFETGQVDLYWNKKEFLFALISEGIYKYRLHPQIGFFIFSFIQFFFLCVFINKYKFKRYDLFLFIFFYCATSFINQTNAVRQYTAMYIFLVATFYIYKRNFFKYAIYILFASMFHRSALLLLPLYFANILIKHYKNQLFLIEMLVMFILLYTGIDFFAIKLIEKTMYASYINSDYFLLTNRKSFLLLATKLIYLPFYLRFFNLKTDNLTDRDKFFIHLGFLAYCVKIVSMSSFFLGRFALYFDLLSYIPLYYYLNFIIANKVVKKEYRLFELFIFICFTVGPYLLKTLVVPKNEYVYQSWFFI